MNYQPYWDLTTIPDDELRYEVARRRGRVPLSATIENPARQEYRQRNNLSAAKYRAKKRAENPVEYLAHQRAVTSKYRAKKRAEWRDNEKVQN